MSDVETLLEMARSGRVYPSVVLYGADGDRRRDLAWELGRRLLCEADEDRRSCGECRHCRRVDRGREEAFHPDVHVLERDLRTVTSAEGTKAFLASAWNAPYEARGQVFVITEAETLSPEAADALLKILEEPPLESPRTFLLLASSRHDLLPTLLSRSLVLYLGASRQLEAERVDVLVERLRTPLESWARSSSPIWILAIAEVLADAGGWEDPRDPLPWATAAAAVVRSADHFGDRPELRRRWLAFAGDLFEGPRYRVRRIPEGRLLEGWLSRHLAVD